MMHLYDDMVVSAPGNLSPRRVPLAGCQCSWEINGPGSLSAFIRLDDVRGSGLGGDLKGYWLTYATSAGAWGGVITGQPTTGTYMEIAAQGFLALVKGRVLTDPLVAMGGSAGGLARRALAQAGAGNPTFLALGAIDEGGGALTLDLTGDVANDVLPQLAEAGDVEWVVTAERVFTLARRLGHDRSATVRLVEDRHIAQARVNDDLETTTAGQVLRVQSELSQAVLTSRRPQATQPTVQPPTNPAVPTTPSPLPKPPVWGWKSAGLGGLLSWVVSGMAEAWQSHLQTYTVELPGVASTPDTNAAPPPWYAVPVGIGANNPAVAARRHVPPPTVPAELTLANIDGCFLAFDLGDTVRVDLGSIGVTGRFRVMSKALDVATQTLTVAGELLKDA